MRLTTALSAAAAVALLAASATSAAGATYPGPGEPSNPAPRPGGATTLKVCKSGCAYKTIQSGVNAAKSGDTVKVADGTYREGVKVTGHKYDNLKIVGNVSNPLLVKIIATGKANGIEANGADNVTMSGMYAEKYKRNGFFAVNVSGYTLTHLVANGTGQGVYGIYAFNSKGGTISYCEAYYNSDSGIYIGQTPPQSKPKRSIVRNVKSWGNVLGFSGTNMKYVTITKSYWYNNGLGIVPNALDSEKYAPPEENVISDNDIFWNNYNYYAGAPFVLHPEATGEITYPVGTGLLLFGSKTTRVEGNRFFGNFLMGFGEIQQLLLKNKSADDLVGNQVTGNKFGKGGTDLNGRDIFYDGSGKLNCFAGNTLTSPTLPIDGSTLVACPGNSTMDGILNGSARAEALGWVITPDKSKPETFEQFWVRHTHAPMKIGGKTITPLVRYAK